MMNRRSALLALLVAPFAALLPSRSNGLTAAKCKLLARTMNDDRTNGTEMVTPPGMFGLAPVRKEGGLIGSDDPRHYNSAEENFAARYMHEITLAGFVIDDRKMR